MSYAAEDWAWEQKCPSSSAKTVLVCLAFYATKEGERAFPSVETMSRRTELDERTIRKAIGQLINAGLMTAHPRQTPNGKQKTTEYRLIIRERPPAKMSGVGPFPWSAPPAKMQEVEAEIPPAKMSPINGETPCKNAPRPPAKMGGNPLVESKKERKNVELRSTPPAVPAATLDVRKQLWTEGRAILRDLTGQLNGQAGTQIGAFLKRAAGDCTLVLEAMRAARTERPAEPIPWIFAAIKHRSAPAPEFDPANLTGAGKVLWRIKRDREAMEREPGEWVQ